MDLAVNSRKQATLEEFLEDLLLPSNSPEQIDLLLEFATGGTTIAQEVRPD